MLFRMQLIIGVFAVVCTMFTKGQNCPIQCEEITPTSCKGLSYTNTGFPNYFGHANQNDPTYVQITSLIPTASLICPQAKDFLCGLLAPQCVQNSGLIFPSKTSCEQFASTCSSVLLTAGITLDCNASPFMDTPAAQCNTLPTIPMMPMQSTPVVPSVGGTIRPSPSNSAGGMTNTTPPCSIPCEPITISQCTSQSYSLTGFPNLFGHPNQAAVDEFALYIDIAEATMCYARSRELLCRSLLPECRENEGLILPNRQMCSEFLAGCGDLLAAQAGDLQIDCNILQVNPEPVCYAQPTIPTTEVKMSTAQSTMSNADSESDQRECPDQKCSAFSVKQNTFILLMVVFMLKLM